MAAQASPVLKTFSFGGCDFGRTSPAVGALSPTTKMLNIEIDFEEALKLHLAIGECIRKLNSYNRSTEPENAQPSTLPFTFPKVE